MKSRRYLIIGLLALIAMMAMMVACGAQPTPETITMVQTVEVEKIVTKEVETIVTKEVEVEKEVEVVITATPVPSGGQLIFGLYQEPQILNPYIAAQFAAEEAFAPVVEGLLGVDPDGNRYPLLAKEVPSVQNGLVSEDGMHVTYNLKDDILWSDGTPFTCDDVLFTYEAITNPESGAVSTTGYDKLENVECVDDHTVTLNFAEFYAPYLGMFNGTHGIMPRHATGAPEDMQKWVYNWHPIGTGPFKIQEWVSGDHITYVPNENYRDYPDKPKLDKLIIRIIPSREVGKALIRTGEIDILWDLTEADIPEFDDISDVVVNSRPGPSTERLLLNLADPTLDATDDPLNNPHWALGDLRVRQAIQIAIDKDFIDEELLYGLVQAGTTELNIGWAKGDIPPSVYDPDQAMVLLEEAGWTDEDGDGVRECHSCLYAEEGTPLKLKIQTTTGNKLREQVEQVIMEMLGDVGVELYIENVPSSVLFGSWSSGAFRKHGNFDILMYATSPKLDPQSHVEGYFASYKMPTESNKGTGFNYSRWISKEFDDAVIAAGATPNMEERQQYYQTAMEAIAAGIPHIYLYDRAEIHLSRVRVQGFAVNPWGTQAWNTADWAVAQ